MNNPETWYYLQQGATVGPMSRPQMESMIRSGTLTRETLVWPGYGDWIAAGSSTLSAVFLGGFSPAAATGSKNWIQDLMPKDKNLRTVVMALIALAGAFLIYQGVQQIKEGTSGGSGQDASIAFQGCRGISASAVQCAYQNTGTVKKRLCMDIVVMCADGRHVASACSDRMDPGESSTKTVTNFKPDITQNMACTNITYENLVTK